MFAEQDVLRKVICPVQLQFKPQTVNRLREKFPAPSFHDDGGRGRLTEEGFKLLSGLLTLNPDKRLTAAEALQSKWCAPALPYSPFASWYLRCHRGGF